MLAETASITFAKYAQKNVHYNKINNAKKEVRGKYDFNITKYKQPNYGIPFCSTMTGHYATRYLHIVSLRRTKYKRVNNRISFCWFIRNFTRQDNCISFCYLFICLRLTFSNFSRALKVLSCFSTGFGFLYLLTRNNCGEKHFYTTEIETFQD